MNQAQTIPCPTPNCTGQIVFNTYQLLAGASFGCAVCGGAVSLSGESRTTLSDAMQKFDEMKAGLTKVKSDNNMS